MISIIVYIDLYLLYECLVKLGTITKKCLIIDIMAIRQSYKRRELQEVYWINSNNNPIDAITKSAANMALEKFLNNNQLTIRLKG